MSGFESDIQEEIYSILNDGLEHPVYDEVPDLPEGQPDANFPYVVIGDDTAVPFDTDDQQGAEATLTIHVWSRYHGRKEAKDILGEIYRLLNRAKLSIVGYNTVDVLWEFSETFTETDNATRHGVSRYRITLQET